MLWLDIRQTIIPYVCKGMLNRKCVVLPPSCMDDVTPEVVVASVIIPRPLIFAINALYRNAFPVSLGPSIKK